MNYYSFESHISIFFLILHKQLSTDRWGNLVAWMKKIFKNLFLEKTQMGKINSVIIESYEVLYTECTRRKRYARYLITKICFLKIKQEHNWYHSEYYMYETERWLWRGLTDLGNFQVWRTDSTDFVYFLPSATIFAIQ